MQKQQENYKFSSLKFILNPINFDFASRKASI